ncbi:hypothetical protein OK349_08125 [Sphingomonas sp. BT-65]|uniref:hypothetical protein n=1 Tax=Sphingomonas sp. BT-65 TaxID=2989821 RepID=UPI002236212A|nr:hypothetical protein [Sphingomonas sp. BT-65]MCW4461673.1 hypothetical protein [Sphingomonas sp. BT-65]
MALIIGIVTVFVPIGLASILGVKDVALAEEWAVLLFLVGFVAAPFTLLALSGVNRWRAWLVAGGITLFFWSLLWSVALVRGGAGGANIGLGFLMLISPLIVTAAAFASVRRTPPD